MKILKNSPSHIFPEHIYKRLEALTIQAKPYAKPNPAVAAIIITQNGTILGEAGTQNIDHAELGALAKLSAKEYRAKGLELLVSLSPCSFQGRTPACTTAIIESGIRKVAMVLHDNDPRMQGEMNPKTVLGKKGIKLYTPFPKGFSRKLFFYNIDYFFRQCYGQPLVTLKYAMTLDGRMAARDGRSKWISSWQAREHARRQRAFADAVWVGARTFFLDNPGLKSSFEEEKETSYEKSGRKNHPKHARAVVFLERDFLEEEYTTLLTNGYQLLEQEKPEPLFFLQKGFSRALKLLEHKNRECYVYPASALTNGLAFSKMVCQAAKQFSWNSIFVEGGARTLYLFRQARLFHRVMAYIAPVFFSLQNADEGQAPFTQLLHANTNEKNTSLLQVKNSPSIQTDAPFIGEYPLEEINLQRFNDENGTILISGYTHLAKIDELSSLLIPA